MSRRKQSKPRHADTKAEDVDADIVTAGEWTFSFIIEQPSIEIIVTFYILFCIVYHRSVARIFHVGGWAQKFFGGTTCTTDIAYVCRKKGCIFCGGGLAICGGARSHPVSYLAMVLTIHVAYIIIILGLVLHIMRIC